ncbi:glutamate 5-kinase [Moritella viscosa]|uniref:Glutamate 5-kinase n=1 Tax=Moritella viscosa TaxID=80854 RepID=A0ABY1H6Y7_9GAMM|nr:glutamate 5-kinase [Moritella viscosa]SGY82711.1 Glutamate 5-kinase-Gamma-glutamyl kinase [Moritella viscosa]SGY83009.1 Glutamate 5-kinase-Gamma-glutamyl kinase [Moritella viscosa]SGY83057.1 Glutamate 5-kinase-Gamma-glutamyl kinase [Moritella viscosa]SGY83617.1 Glutamate 5-kinase-Gamma-glutamyl kinase [Moritella viscosa]SHO24253.1 Glutamate 5-kinase-Gamma-glutamyl kinase [Moritella viscosa]
MAKKTIVVKLGTSVLTSGTAKIDRAHMVELVRQCAQLYKQGHDIIVVTSGAIAAGREHLGAPELPPTMANKQMLAAVGQSQLIFIWQSLFNIYGLNVGQMLLTRADLDDRERFLNARDTMRALLDNRIVPIINENDAVAIAEIKVGDNDNLSALAAILANADTLMLLTDQEGLFTADPRNNPDAKLIEVVDVIDDELRQLAGGTVGGLGTGGMATKLQAAEIACRSGIDVVIAAGVAEDVVLRVAEGKRVGTLFPSHISPLESRKQWILAGPPPSGVIIIDDGAVNAVTQKGSSLLPKGISEVSAIFKRGDVVQLQTLQGKLLGRGICRYTSDELTAIAGCHSCDIESKLGYGYGAVAIHRDDLVLF